MSVVSRWQTGSAGTAPVNCLKVVFAAFGQFFFAIRLTNLDGYEKIFNSKILSGNIFRNIFARNERLFVFPGNRKGGLFIEDKEASGGAAQRPDRADDVANCGVCG